MPEVEMSAGTIEYQDTGGDEPVVVLLHGLAMDGLLWRHVIRELSEDHSWCRRCRWAATGGPWGRRRPVPTRHRGAGSRVPKGAGPAPGDPGRQRPGPVPARRRPPPPECTARLVITACEAFGNFPHGLPGRTVALAGRLPGGLNAPVQPLRVWAPRRLPLALGWMAKRPIPHAVTDAWLRPLLGQPPIRRDLTKYLRAAAKDLA